MPKWSVSISPTSCFSRSNATSAKGVVFMSGPTHCRWTSASATSLRCHARDLKNEMMASRSSCAAFHRAALLSAAHSSTERSPGSGTVSIWRCSSFSILRFALASLCSARSFWYLAPSASAADSAAARVSTRASARAAWASCCASWASCSSRRTRPSASRTRRSASSSRCLLAVAAFDSAASARRCAAATKPTRTRSAFCDASSTARSLRAAAPRLPRSVAIVAVCAATSATSSARSDSRLRSCLRMTARLIFVSECIIISACSSSRARSSSIWTRRTCPSTSTQNCF